MKAIIFDTETTGLNEPEIVSAAWVDAFSIGVEPTHQFFKPSKEIELGAVATHCIFPYMLESCPPSADFQLPSGVEFLVGWNIDFDWMAIGSPDVKRIDLCCIARKLYQGLDSYSQTAIYLHLFGMTPVTRQVVMSAHSAAADVQMCKRIFEHILDVEDLSLSEYWNLSEESRVPTEMPFGKHKGLHMSEVPPDYRRWYANCTNPPPDKYILAAFEKWPFGAKKAGN